MSIKLNSIAAIFIASLAAGCAPNLNEVKPDPLPIPGGFTDAKAGAADTPPVAWQEFFPDPRLRELIQLALKNNQELHLLDQEIQITGNEVMARQGEYLPKLDLSARGGVEKVGEETSQGVSDKAHEVPERLTPMRAGLVATWEVDIWKKLRNASKAAYLRYLSSIEGRRFAVTRLVAEISRTYFELLALDNQLGIVDSYVGILKKAAYMVKLQKNAGRVTSLPVNRFDAEVLKNEAKQIELRQQILMTQNRLNTLVGRFPQKIERDPQSLLSLKLKEVGAGLPSRVLENRPDVKSASLEIEAAKLDLASTKARFYPSLSIDAGIGYESFNLSHLLKAPASVFYGAMGSLTAPLLNRQAIKADYQSANSKQIQAIYHYEQTLVQAFADVVNQMNMIQNLNQVYDLKSKQVEQMEEAARTSNVLFQAARVDYVESLLTQRDTLEARIELVEVKKRQLAGYVDLYQAVGGGWAGTDRGPK